MSKKQFLKYTRWSRWICVLLLFSSMAWTMMNLETLQARAEARQSDPSSGQSFVVQLLNS
ncbi:MAG: hypothetical protein AAF902_03030 [Chloroflexota bacterium]